MDQGEDRIKTTISMRRTVWTTARTRAVQAGKPVGDWLEQLIVEHDQRRPQDQ